MRSPATPVPYSFQQRQRAKWSALKGIFGAVPSQACQSKFDGDRSGGGGYCHAPVGVLRPQQQFHHRHLADDSALIEVSCRGAQGGAGPL